MSKIIENSPQFKNIPLTNIPKCLEYIYRSSPLLNSFILNAIKSYMHLLRFGSLALFNPLICSAGVEYVPPYFFDVASGVLGRDPFDTK